MRNFLVESRQILLLGILLSTSLIAGCGNSRILEVPTATLLPIEEAVEATLTALARARISPSSTPLDTLSAIQTDTPPPAIPFPSVRIVFSKDGNLWVWSGDQPVQLTSSTRDYRPSISDDGELIAFARQVDDYHEELWIIDSDGKEERRIVSVADLDKIGGGVRDPSALAVTPYDFSWLPGSHVLAFNTRQVFEGPGLALLDDLNLVDTDTGQLTFLLLAGWGGRFIFSPIGDRIAISTPTSIIITSSDGKEYRPILTYEQVITYSEYLYYATPQWSADGKSLWVAIPPADPLRQPPDYTILWEISPGDGGVRQAGKLITGPFFLDSLSFSPDLQHLAFLRDYGDPGENRQELILARQDGTQNVIYLVEQLLRFLGWAPDSRHFLFMVGEEQEIWLGEVGGEPQRLVGLQAIVNPRWVDNRHFLAIKAGEGHYMFLMASFDGRVRVIEEGAGFPPLDYDFNLQD